jgi:hypothetical protein
MGSRRTGRSRRADNTADLVIALIPAVDAGLALLEKVPKAQAYARAIRRVTRLGASQDPAVLKKLYRSLTK